MQIKKVFLLMFLALTLLGCTSNEAVSSEATVKTQTQPEKKGKLGEMIIVEPSYVDENTLQSLDVYPLETLFEMNGESGIYMQVHGTQLYSSLSQAGVTMEELTEPGLLYADEEETQPLNLEDLINADGSLKDSYLLAIVDFTLENRSAVSFLENPEEFPISQVVLVERNAIQLNPADSISAKYSMYRIEECYSSSYFSQTQGGDSFYLFKLPQGEKMEVKLGFFIKNDPETIQSLVGTTGSNYMRLEFFDLGLN